MQLVSQTNPSSNDIFQIEDGYVLIDIIAFDRDAYTSLKELIKGPAYGLKDEIPNGSNTLINYRAFSLLTTCLNLIMIL
jgi:hypothetical protein